MSGRGFTLFETVVSLLILSLVSVASLGVISQQAESARRLQSRVLAATLAEDRLESIRALGGQELRRMPSPGAWVPFAPPHERFRWAAVVRQLDGDYGLFGAEVRVAGPGGDLLLSTTIYRPIPPLTLVSRP